ncbi:MAG: hypothetical protein KA248_02055 [Kiritimatiellae bacterium]|nr:hypothetical protein [Kiritimatiellia bacterium]
MKRVRAWLAGGLAVLAPAAWGAYDWTNGPWGVLVDLGGAAGSPLCRVEFPGGGAQTGNAVAVHYQFTPVHAPQLWALLTDGFWRQTSQESELLTSYRLFRYFGSGNENCDRLAATGMKVLGTNAAGELEIETAYENHSASGDRFDVTGRATLEAPDLLRTAMRAALTVSNASGRAVVPHNETHRLFGEQWELFGASSMHVVTNLTHGLPSWYDLLDPLHRYVGVTNNADFLDDGYSVNSGKTVSTHDVKYIVASGAVVGLDYDTNVCPIVYDPGYLWYSQMVLRAHVSPDVRLQHAYRSARNHRIELVSCDGLTAEPTNLKWTVDYDRKDTNMVDGDNVQVKLGLDDFLPFWPDGGVQVVRVRMETGNTPPAVTRLSVPSPDAVTLEWTAEPGERYNLQHAPAPDGTWSNVIVDVAGPALGPLPVPAGMLRLSETNNP